MRPELESTLTMHPQGETLEIRGEAGAVHLSPSQVLAVMLANGRRAVRDVVSALWALDLPVPPGEVQDAFARLVQTGLARDTDPRRLPQRVLPGTGHRCDGCGRSCQSQRVGALSPEEVARIEAIWPALQAAEPSLHGFSPFRRERGGVYLERVDSQCLFLDGQNRCMIHRHFGPADKPNMCRMYPFVRVLTETGIRLGVAPGCTRAHVNGDDTPDGEQLAALPAETFDREVAVSHPLQIGGRRLLRRAFDMWERRTMALLDAPESTLASVARFIVPTDGDEAGPHLIAEIPARLRAGGLTPVAMPRHSLGQLWTRLLTVNAPFPPKYNQRRQTILFTLLRDTVWTRDTVLFDTPIEGLAAVLAGFVLACAEPDDDTFGEALAAWVRLLHTGARDHLFRGEAEAQTLWRSARSWTRED